jgi:membrane protease YdiL (CAAX protease family)
MLGALLPAFLMGYIEGRSVDDYGLPRRQAFGKMFWIGAVWGLVAITILLVAMRAVHVVSFGPVVLHGIRIVKFAAFWAVFFLLVGVFEEFLLRGYLLFTTAQRAGFWPAAALLSCAFGAIHLNNAGEGLVGALGAAAIGFFFCLTLRRTGNLWFAVGFHASWDWGETYLYAVPNSGTNAPGHLLSSSFSGNPWLTGGTVGPEGSVLCFVLLVVLWVVFDRLYPAVMYKTDLPRRRRSTVNTALGIAGDDIASGKTIE